MNAQFLINRYKYFLISFLICIIIYFVDSNLGINIFISTKSSIDQMLSVLPAIMILLALLDVWVPKEYFIKYMGSNSGVIGITLTFLIAFFSAGPMYAAFPFTAVLIKKGVKFSNVIIFLNAWCVTKFSTLLFEISALGSDFTLIRLIIDIPGVIIMGYIVNYIVNRKRTIG
ncbi:Predicted permease [uncultured Clostridium sp.]|nr:Predicted permease [uncultured Clostridium sp.]SCI96471.1 Predicted permease [uncultured Clostridium sp.]